MPRLPKSTIQSKLPYQKRKKPSLEVHKTKKKALETPSKPSSERKTAFSEHNASERDAILEELKQFDLNLQVIFSLY